MIYNRIPIVFGGLNKVTGPTITYQFDTRQILIFRDLTLPEYYEVDICNEGDTTTVTMVGTSDGVLIPSKFLRTGKKIKVYLVYQGTDPGATETRKEVTLPVQIRPAREDIDPSEPEQQQIDELVVILNDAAEAVEAIQDMGVEASTLSEGSSATVEKSVDPETGAVTLSFGIPRGNTGETGQTGPAGADGSDGFSPTLTVSNITGGHRITIVDKTQTQTVDVMDGEDGEQGEQGPTGNGIQSIAKTGTSGLVDTYTITYTNGNTTTFTVTNGQDGAVLSVAGKTGAVTLDGGDVAYSNQTTYSSGTVGAELGTLKSEITDISENASISLSGLTAQSLYINDTKLSGATSARLLAIPATGIKTFHVTCSVSSTKRIGFVDSVANNATVDGAAEYTGTGDAEITNTDNHAYLVIQLFINSDSEQDVSTYISGMTVTTLTALDSVARSLGITGATVGKYAKVKTVDENGKPTSWETGSGGGGGGGTSDYTDLSNKPSINSVTLTGNKTASDLGLGTYSKPSGGIPSTDLASGVIPGASDATPQALGTAAAGSSANYSRADHVHAKPTASDVGAIAAPSSPSTGAFLVYNGSAWVAQSLSTWQGGNY